MNQAMQLLNQNRKGTSEKDKLQKALRQLLNIQNKLSAEKVRAARLEELIMLIDFDREGRIAVSDQVIHRIKREQIEICRRHQRDWMANLPFKNAQVQGTEIVQ